jgi:ribosomal protein S6
MDKEHMPVADAAHYELAFHVLPTVAEGEVADVFTSLKNAVEKAGGTITAEEAPKRFDLAYEVIKYLEGRNRKFTSAYFGWVRFTLTPEQLAELTEAVEGEKRLLRHLLIRLTKMEEANPFMFHEALEDDQIAKVVDFDEEDEEEEAESEDKEKEVEAEDGKEAVEEVK